MMYRKIGESVLATRAQTATAQPQIIGISGLFAYNSNGDLVPVNAVSSTDSQFELNGGGDLQPKA
jgi:hypothetical protein